jgi:hypothetical protein
MKINQKTVQDLFNYDPKTGVFTWKTAMSRKTPIGTVAGFLKDDGYWSIGFNWKQFRADKLAWLYVYGEYPMTQVIHIDGNTANSAIDNLTLEKSKQQIEKEAISFTYLATKKGGVTRKWMAHIEQAGKMVCLGAFETKRDAKDAYINYMFKQNS